MRMAIPVFLLMGLTACAHEAPLRPTQNPQAFAAAVQKFLDDKGGYCLGKPDWPRQVTDLDRRKHRPDALQMPVLERLGVVSSGPAPGDSTNVLYSLTPAGKKFYVDYPTVSPAAAGAAAADVAPRRSGDLCVAQLRVLKAVKWTPIQAAGGVSTTTVSYTYEVAKAAPWTDEPDFRKVFPVVAEVLSSGNKLEMMLPLRWSGRAWESAVPAY